MLDVHPPHHAATTWRIALVFLAATLMSFRLLASSSLRPPLLARGWFKCPLRPTRFTSSSSMLTAPSSNPTQTPATHSTATATLWAHGPAPVAVFTAKLVETAADRTTHEFISRTELAMSIQSAIQLASRHRGQHRSSTPTGKPDGTPSHPFTFDGDRILP